MKKTNQRKADATKLNYRLLSVAKNKEGAPATLDEETRSVEVVGATETPVEVFDYERLEIVNEILLMDGCEMPATRQVPLLDTHWRTDSKGVIGSYRNMTVSDEGLVGRAFFSIAQEAEGPYVKMKEGHLTDFSVGYRVISSMWVPADQTAKIGGRSYEGPIKITTRWRVKELSICPIAADEMAKTRAAWQPEHDTKNITTGENNMNKKLRELLEQRGLSADASEDEAWGFFLRMNTDFVNEKKLDAGEDLDSARAEGQRLERERVDEITAWGERLGCEDEAKRLIKEGVLIDEARKALLKLDLSKTDGPGQHKNIEVGQDERDKFRGAAQDAMLIRSGILIKDPHAGARDLAGYSLREVARECLRISGIKSPANPLEMVGRAMMTGDFQNILANVANKSIFAGWESAEETWDVWCGVGSVPDFKTNYLPRVSETEGLDEIPDGMPYDYGKRIDATESFAIATYGKLFAITRQAIINDDLGALTDIPMAHGEAAKRKIGDVAYAVLTSNSAMGDGVALFAAGHSNLAGAGAAPGTSTIAAGILAMKKQKDLQGLRTLNIRPQFFIATAALEGSSEIFFRSGNFSDSDTIATDSSLASTRVNPYAGAYFTRVYEPRLDDNSATEWYLAAAKGKTVNVYFLNGVQLPYLESKNGWDVDGVEYKVRLDCGAKAVDWKGLYKNAGA